MEDITEERYPSDEVLEEPLLNTVSNDYVEKASGCGVKWRYVICCASFFGLFVSICQRVAFTICVVAMMNTSHVDAIESDQCPHWNATGNHTKAKNGQFNWDPEVEGQLLGAFYYGYVISQLPGGYLADRFGASKIMGASTLLSGALTALTPAIVSLGPTPLIISRIAIGLFQGPLYPAHHGLWGKWAPELERSKLYSYSSLGGDIAAGVASILSGYLCDSSFLGGWPSPLYISGGISCLWFLIWICVSHDSPAKHRFISDTERKFIEKSIWKNTTIGYSGLPWMAMLKSSALWGLVTYSFLDGLGFYVVFSFVPLYFKEVLHFDMSEDSLLTSMPYVEIFVGSLLVAPLADLLIRKHILSTTNVRKIFTVVGELPTCPVLVAMVLVGCDYTAAGAIIVAGGITQSFTASGDVISILDFAPRYAGTLMGVINTFANIGGFVSPAVVTRIVKDGTDFSKWRVVFFVTAALYVLKVLVFLIFATSKEQEWAIGNQPDLITNSEAVVSNGAITGNSPVSDEI